MRSVIYAHLPQTLSLQPFIEHLYQHEECLKTFSEELTEIFHSFLESHLEIQSYIEDRVKDIELLPSVLEEEEVVASLKELVASISELVDRFSDPHRRLVAIHLRFPNIIRIEVVECHDLLLGLNTMDIG